MEVIGWASQLGYNDANDWREIQLGKNSGTTGVQGLTGPQGQTSGWYINVNVIA